MKIDIILVPQGVEYQAVVRGVRATPSLVRKNTKAQPLVLPIPLGSPAVTAYLRQWPELTSSFESNQLRIVLMGLCGGLSPNYHLGDIMVYQDCLCLEEQSIFRSEQILTNQIYEQLQPKANFVTGLTSNRIICQSGEKLQLGQTYQAGVIDMESFAVLKILNLPDHDLAVVRVVGDSCEQDLPQLNRALREDGSLGSISLAFSLLKSPRASIRLVRSSLAALQILQEVATSLLSLQVLD